MDRVMNFLRHVWAAEDLRNRILITIGLLVIYRLAAHIPVPGINADAVQQLLNQGQGGVGGNLVGLLDLLSGGTVSNLSVLAMGVYPYITAQIILQLLTPVIPRMQQLQEEDPTCYSGMQER